MSVWAIPTALAGALCYALAAALQQREAGRVHAHGRAGGRLILRLARRPWWLAGLAATAVGAVLHVTALRFGTLVVVQPIGVTGLLFALPLEAVLHSRRTSGRDLVAAAAVVLGLAGLLLSVQVRAGTPSISERATLELALATAAVVVLATLAGARGSGVRRTLAFAAAAAVAYGVASALARVVGHRASVLGWEDAVEVWASLALVVAAFAGLLLSQAAYQSGRLGVALPTLMVVDPLVAIAVGQLLLGEPVHFTAAGGLSAAAAAVLIVLGTVWLARSASPPHPAAPQPELEILAQLQPGGR